MLRFGRSIVSSLTGALLFAAGSAHADHHVPFIYATAWGETLAQDGTGFYNEIAADILKKTPTEEIYQLQPYRRAKVSFYNTKDACLFPSSLEALEKAGQIDDPAKFVESNGLFTARTHLFVRAGETPPKSLDDIFGKSIAYPNGSVVRSQLEGHGARLISVNNEEDKAEMLLSGRVDMISGMIPDTALVFSNIDSAMPVYEPSLALYEVEVTFVCHRNDKNERFVKEVNEALDALAVDANYRARMAAASLAQHELARASGDVSATTEQILNDLAPSAGGGSRKAPKARSGRRQPMRSNR